jgi:hypothetical protein
MSREPVVQSYFSPTTAPASSYRSTPQQHQRNTRPSPIRLKGARGRPAEQVTVLIGAAIYVSIRSVTFGEVWCGTLVWDRHTGGSCDSSNRNRELVVAALLGGAFVMAMSTRWPRPSQPQDKEKVAA